MPTDYILFIHGVKTHHKEEFLAQANGLFHRIQKAGNGASRTLKPLFLFWGDLNLDAQQELRGGLTTSAVWPNLWFKNFRSNEILEFVGDAALYLSRHVGSLFVKRLRELAITEIEDVQPGDRLHLVTHSWGTVILFDILFAGRWGDDSLEAEIRKSVQRIRSGLFGLHPSPSQGIPLASIHTMGSPLALFSLINLSTYQDGVSSHDLTQNLKELLEVLHDQQGTKLPWYNYLHPGDPIAYPLAGILPLILDSNHQYVDPNDVLTYKGNFFNLPALSQSIMPILKGGEAHGSYWQNDVVAQGINSALNRRA